MDSMFQEQKKTLKKAFLRLRGINYIFKEYCGEENFVQQDHVIDWTVKFVEHVIQIEKNLLSIKNLKKN